MPADLTEARAALAAFTESSQRIVADRLTGKRKAAPMNRTMPNAVTYLRAALAEVDRLTAELGKITEQKPRIDCLPNGELDDVVLCGVVHIERMSDTHVWIGVDTAEDYVSFNIATKHEPLVWQQQDGDLEPGVSARAAEVARPMYPHQKV